MDPTISQAIREMRLLTFTYKNVTRVVEPHCYGRDTAGHDALCAWQLSGKLGDQPEWRFYEVSRMSFVQIKTEKFANARQGYKRGDSRMTTIYEQL